MSDLDSISAELTAIRKLNTRILFELIMQRTNRSGRTAGTQTPNVTKLLEQHCKGYNQLAELFQEIREEQPSIGEMSEWAGEYPEQYTELVRLTRKSRPMD